MSAGFQVFRDNGTLQFDANLMTFAFLQKGTISSVARQASNTAPSTILIPLPSTSPKYLVATRCSYAIASVGQINDKFYFQCNGPVGTSVDYYIFTKAAEFPTSTYGLELFNESGQMTFSSNRRLLDIRDLVSGIGSHYSYPGGLTYASIQTKYAGISYENSDTVYKDGVAYASGGVEEQDDGANHLWSRLVHGKLFGTSWSGQNLSLEEVSNDDVVGQTNNGRTPDPARSFWSSDINNVMVIDVTGL